MTPKDMQRLVAEIKTILQLSAREFPPYDKVLKWDRNQPRGPKGTRTGGRWVKDVSVGLSHTPQGFQESSTLQRQASQMRGRGNANYADIMNAPTGTGFHNRPRGVDLPELPKSTTGSLSPEKEKTIQALKEGTVTDSRPLGGGGVNASVIVTMDDGTEAVYKPERGESWHASFSNHEITEYITNKDFSLAAREAFAFEVDTALGLGIVPETVLREQVDETNINVNTSGDDDGGGGGYDEDYAREQYEEYKEKMIDDDSIMDEVGQRFEAKFDEAKKDHAKEIEDRAQEILDIWNEEAENFPDNPAGTGSALREHPVLPLGSKGPFERREDKGVLDPIDVIDEAKVDVTSEMNEEEEDRVREIIRQKLAEGYQEYGDIDPDRAAEHLDRDDWYQEHENTEAEIRDSVYGEKVQSFTSWRKSQGYRSDGSYGGGGGSGEDQNPDAPHPQGGSFQNFRSNADNYGNMSAEDGAKLAVLDYVIGTMDRHGGNLMFEGDTPVAIDNGYSMPGGMDSEDDFKFRSEGVNEWYHSSKSRNVPSELRAQLHEAMERTDWNALVARHPGMSADEKEAFLGRVSNMTIALQTEEGLRELWSNMRRM